MYGRVQGVFFRAFVAGQAGELGQLKDTKITVNAVMPAAMDTWRTRKMPNAEPDKWVKPSEVAELLCSLCSDEWDIVSGSVLKVFGKL